MTDVEQLVDDIFDEVQSHALRLGLFDRVNLHEPKSSPQNGLTCAIWVQEFLPIALASGLTASSMRLILYVRIYQNMLMDPMDLIDPNMLKATAKLMAEYSADFTLDGKIRNVDLLGQDAQGLSSQAGYINQDGKLFRVMTIHLPLIVNDVFNQEA